MKLNLGRILKLGLDKILNFKFSRDAGWDFEVDAWSRFLRWIWSRFVFSSCDMTWTSYFGKQNSTLGSVVPLAMFICLSPLSAGVSCDVMMWWSGVKSFCFTKEPGIHQRISCLMAESDLNRPWQVFLACASPINAEWIRLDMDQA